MSETQIAATNQAPGTLNLDTAEALDPVSTDLFSLSATRIVMSAGIGHRVSAQSTLTAKQDIRVTADSMPGSNNPSAPTDFGGSLTGNCPSLFMHATMKAGDTCTFESYFEPGYHMSAVGPYWGINAQALAPNGVPVGEILSQEVTSHSRTLQATVSDIVADPVQVWMSGPASFHITNPGNNTVTVRLSTSLSFRLPGKEAHETIDVIAAPNSITEVPYLFEPTRVGEERILMSALVTSNALPDSTGGYLPVSWEAYFYGEGTCVEPFLTASYVDFEEVVVGSTKTMELKIRNTSDELIAFDSEPSLLAHAESALTVGQIPSHLPPKSSVSVPLTWAPDSHLEHEYYLGAMKLQPLDPHSDTVRKVTVHLYGSTAPAPASPTEPEDEVDGGTEPEAPEPVEPPLNPEDEVDQEPDPEPEAPPTTEPPTDGPGTPTPPGTEPDPEQPGRPGQPGQPGQPGALEEDEVQVAPARPAPKPGASLANTGGSGILAPALGGGAALVVAGIALLAARRRRGLAVSTASK